MESLSQILNEFIIQANEGSLKTSKYPREYLDLKMKVSFGMGMAARVPWISLTAPGMSASNGYFPVYLYYKEQNVLVLSYGISETSEAPVNWTTEIQESKVLISDKVPGAARYGNSYVHKMYAPKIVGNSVTFLSDGKEIGSEILDKDLVEITNYYKKTLEIEEKTEGSIVSSGLFYMEQQLEDFIIENWEKTELGSKYDLIYEEGTLKSQQYITDIGRIDILAKDKKSGNYVVIELKKNQSSDDTVGQILRYMGWISEKKNDSGVKGIIVAGKYDEKLYYAQQMIKDIDVFLYEVNFSLKGYSR
jgi:hypothetical protein